MAQNENLLIGFFPLWKVGQNNGGLFWGNYNILMKFIFNEQPSVWNWEFLSMVHIKRSNLQKQV